MALVSGKILRELSCYLAVKSLAVFMAHSRSTCLCAVLHPAVLKDPLGDESKDVTGDMSLMRNPCWTAWSTCHVLDFRACSPVTALHATTAAHSSPAR